MVKHLLKDTNALVLLIDCNRTSEDIIYRNALNYLENAYFDRLNVYHVLSRAVEFDYSISKNIIKGRLSKLTLKKIIKGVYIKQEEVNFFLCGPTGLIVLAEETIQGMSLHEPQVYKEYFEPEKDEVTLVELPTLPQEVLFHYYEQSNLLEVLPGQSILESALNDKIPMRYSCKGGTCGVCKGKLRNGNLHIHKNFALSDDELKEGYILLCQSYPLNNEVTVVVE
jgi:ring-1,2-phenylacetyl-CoA epoxidase subunit PaaE